MATVDPDYPRALIQRGDALAAGGDARSASSFYRAALRAANGMANVPGDLEVELRRIEAVNAEQGRAYQAHLTKGLAAAGFNAGVSSERFALSLDLMAGRKRLYLQEPQFYLFPGLPQVQFQPRDTLPWLTAVEDAAADIRSELDALLAEPTLFRPYVESRADRPNGDQAGMKDNPDWSAIFLVKDGVDQADLPARCPRTIQALADAPLCRIPGRTPSILFSKLSAGARIPPHHGMINTRLICHLPLIVPSGNRFRVGNDVRDWREARAWAFDDTIEHEARNDGDGDRVILIFDVWKPELTAEERDLVTAMFQTIDVYDGAGAAWGV